MAEVARFCATSGTTGLPVMFGYTQRDVQHLMPYQMTRLLRAGGVVPGERVYQRDRTARASSRRRAPGGPPALRTSTSSKPKSSSSSVRVRRV